MHSAFKRLCALALAVPFAALLILESHAQEQHWQWSASPFFAPEHSAALKVGLTYAPFTSIAEQGWRFRYEGRATGWNDRDPAAPRSYVIEAEDTLYAGYAFHGGPWHAQIYAGATVYSDNQFGFNTEFGVNGIGELVWLGKSGEFVGMEARVSSIKNNWSFSAVSGWPIGWGDLKLGPEAGIGGSITGWNGRLGVAATGLTLAGYDLALGAGAIIDDQDRAGPYVSLWLSGQF